MFGFAKALYPATVSESEAKAKGYSDADIAKAKKAWGGITKIFVKVLQGKEENLKKQIRQGANHYFKKHPIKSLKGFESEESLGEPISTGVSVTAASSALAAGAKVMSSAGLTAGGGKSFMQIIANFFKKNKDKILNVAKKGVQMIKNRKKKGGKVAKAENRVHLKVENLNRNQKPHQIQEKTEEMHLVELQRQLKATAMRMIIRMKEQTIKHL
jgi:hypothetical protein